MQISSCPPLPVLISYSSYLNSQPLSHRGLINHIQMWHLPLANVPGLPQALGQKSCLNCWNGTGRAEGRVGVPLVAWPDIHRSPMSHIAQSRRARVRAHTHTHTHRRSHTHTHTHTRSHTHTHTHTHTHAHTRTHTHTHTHTHAHAHTHTH